MPEPVTLLALKPLANARRLWITLVTVTLLAGSLVEVLLAPIWVWLFLGETATTATFVGGAVLLVAVVLNALIGARERATGAPVLA